MTAYGAPGTYPVQLIAENAFGCRDTTVRTFTVYPTPEALFTVEPSPGCDTYPVTFLNTSVNASAQWWSLGDGTFSTDPMPSYIYPGVGLYDVTLVVAGAGGCLDTLTVPDAVLIQPTPLAAFTYEGSTSVPNALQFTNSSEGAVSYWWNFGDGEQSSVASPLHLYPADGGEVDICLIAINQLGCPDTTCIEVLIPGNPAIYTPNAFTPDGDGLNDDFRPVLDGFNDWRYQLLIFDRWGEVVWETRSRTTAWDGSMNGKPCKTDVYVWKVILDRYGDEREVVGHVTLVRGDY
jgi:gliding motility-associated-like protein